MDRYWSDAGKQGEGLHWIGWDEINRSPDWLSNSVFPRAEVRHASTDHVFQLSLTRRGFGMISTSVYFEDLYPELVRLPGTKPALERSLWILLHSDLRRTTRVRRFVDFLAEELIKLKPKLQGDYL